MLHTHRRSPRRQPIAQFRESLVGKIASSPMRISAQIGREGFSQVEVDEIQREAGREAEFCSECDQVEIIGDVIHELRLLPSIGQTALI